MTRPPAETPLPPDLFDEHGRLRVSLPCVHCDYDLRTLWRSGTCPECGTPVGQTLRALFRCTWPGARSEPLYHGVWMLAFGQTLIASAAPVTLLTAIALETEAAFCCGPILAIGGPVLVALAGLSMLRATRALSLEPTGRLSLSVHRWIQRAGAVGLAALGVLVPLVSVTQQTIWMPLLLYLGGHLLLLPPAASHRLLALLLEALRWPATFPRRLRRVSQCYAAAWAAALILPFSELARRELHARHWPFWTWVPSGHVWAGVAVVGYVVSALFGSIVTWRIHGRLLQHRQWL